MKHERLRVLLTFTAVRPKSMVIRTYVVPVTKGSIFGKPTFMITGTFRNHSRASGIAFRVEVRGYG